jgi:steroid delta-isomerase-like uncharacterized protein
VTQSPAAVARIFHESWTNRDPEAGMAVIADDCEFWDMARGEQLIGPDGYREDYERWLRAFPDGVCEVTRIVEQGEWAVVEFLNRGTNTGPLSNAAGSFPATGRRAEIAYCSVMRIRDGKVIFGRDYYDSGAILRQLALVPD